jgi:hypothetical protein
VSRHPGREPLIRLANKPQSLRFRRAEKGGRFVRLCKRPAGVAFL